MTARAVAPADAPLDLLEPSLPAWRVPRDADVVVRHWGDEVVVHVAHRATTHLLTLAAGNVLAAILDGRPEHTLDEFFACIARGFAPGALPDPAPATPEERFALSEVLQRFEQMGLVEPVDRLVPSRRLGP